MEKPKPLVFDGLDSDAVADAAKIHDFSVSDGVSGEPLYVRTHSRPHVQEFLSIVSKWFDLAVFTASRQNYANKVIDFLDKKRGLFPSNRRFHRGHCDRIQWTLGKAVWIKNLKIVQSDLSKVFLIDDNPGNFFRTIDNGIPIKEWKNDDEEDRALLDLLPMLRELRIVWDVRPVIKREVGDRKQWP